MKITVSMFARFGLACALSILAACGGAERESAAAPIAAVPASVFVATPPDGAIEVNTAVKTAKSGDAVVVRGVVGGRAKAFVDGRAVLVAADTALEPCSEEEGCPTPWDYCCDTPETLLANTMTVQVLGSDGKPLTGTLEGAGGLDELKQIVVSGSVRSNDGSLVIDAERIHVQR